MPDFPITERVLQGTSNSPLPPSVEAAYYRKCIELKRRVEEIETNNDKMRISMKRHTRAIDKLRLERAYLLDTLVRQTSEKASDSDKSSSPPPTPQEKPQRTKRKPAKQSTPPPGDPSGAPLTSPGGPANSTPVQASEAGGQRFETFRGLGSSPQNGPPGGITLPPIQAATGAGYSNGDSGHHHEDVVMEDDSATGSGFAGGFQAVNRRG